MAMLPEEPAFAVQVASGTAFDVREFTAHERISELFSIKVIAVAPEADLDFETITGHTARFDVRAGSARPRTWTGLCRAVHQIAAEESGLSTYEIEIVPALWLATQRRNYRIFQGMSDVDIAVRLLGEWSVEPALNLSGAYKARKYRVQYGETDYAFICRLLEEAGVSFYFSDQDGATGLVLSDAPHASTTRTPRVPFRDHPSDSDREHVTAVRVGRRVRPGKLTVRDHDYRRPANYELRGTATAAGGVEERLEEYHYAPGAFLVEGGNGDATPQADDRGAYRADPVEGEAMARRRLEAHRSEALTCAFETNALDLAPGVVFGMKWHPQRELCDDRDLLVIASTMSGTTGRRIRHTCEARSTDLPFRPALATPKPQTRGVECATVVGPEGEEIHTDEFGRVRVQFHWDREGRWDETSSCWMHVSQPWGGAMYGGVNLPRIGQEVLVDFLGGDPDRPVIVGRMYTNLQRVPYKLPDNKTQSGWKSCSTGGTGGFNEIMFEDAAGKELVRVQAERDLQKLVKNDERVTVRQDRFTRVGRNRTTQIGVADSTLVGEKLLAAVLPASEGAGGDMTSLVMTHRKIVLDTGAGATITMEGDKITLDAKLIEVHARDHADIWGKDRGVDLHAPAAGGKTNVFSGDSFTVGCKDIIIAGEDVRIGADTLKLEGTGSALLTSSGTTNVAGTPVQLNGPGLFAGRVTEQAPDTITTGAALVLVGGASFPLPVVKQADGSLKIGKHIVVKPGTGRYEDFQNKVMRDLGIMASTPAGLQRLNNIDNNRGNHDVTIREYSAEEEATNGKDNSLCYPGVRKGDPAALGYDDHGNPVPGPGANAEVAYNPEIQDGPDGHRAAPPDDTLFHEMGHADHDVNGTSRQWEKTGDGWHNKEEWQTIDGGQNKPGGRNDIPGLPQDPSENDYLGDRGYPYRRTDHGKGYATPDGKPV
jgi:type VI secretion system secreted protein VgrG